MPDTFPSYDPSRNSVKNVTHRTLRSSFGDGYLATRADGINSKIVEWDLEYNDFPIADIQAIETFLDNQAGSTTFLWTPPYESTATKWKLQDEYKSSYKAYGAGSISFKLRQVYI